MSGRIRREIGPFVSFVLLDAPRWDREGYLRELQSLWGLTPPPEALEDGAGEPGKRGVPSLVWDTGSMLATVALMPGPVPGGEAEHNAATNYLWPEAVAVTRGHTAHLMVVVLPRESRPLEAGELLVKLTDAALGSDGVLGVYTAGTVFEPAFYRQAAAVMQGGENPYLAWVYLGLRQGEDGRLGGYTYGLSAFGKEEIEVPGCGLEPRALRSFLLDIAAYVLGNDVTLEDGQTIGFSAEEKLPLTRSPGIFLKGTTVKIGLESPVP